MLNFFINTTTPFYQCINLSEFHFTHCTLSVFQTRYSKHLKILWIEMLPDNKDLLVIGTRTWEGTSREDATGPENVENVQMFSFSGFVGWFCRCLFLIHFFVTVGRCSWWHRYRLPNMKWQPSRLWFHDLWTLIFNKPDHRSNELLLWVLVLFDFCW